VAWRKPAKELTPREVFNSWVEAATSETDGSRALGERGALSVSRPMSAACCERIFAFLEHMDASDRMNMSKGTLKMLLFLRGNHRIVNELISDANASRIRNLRDAAESQQRQREREVAERRAAQLSARPAKRYKSAPRRPRRHARRRGCRRR
jgi:hypothetical protein